MNPTDPLNAAPESDLEATGDCAVLRFTEEMKGYITFLEGTDLRGSAVHRSCVFPLMFHLDITVPDVSRFIREPSHEAKAQGFIRGAPFGGDRPVTDGSLCLLFDGPSPAFKLMRYHLPFMSPDGQPFTLSGLKQVRNDPGFDAWTDTTTLYTSIVWGHVSVDAIKAAKIAATGVLYIHPRDFLKQLGTFSVDAPTALGRRASLARFGKFFLGSLWDVYAERAA